MDESQEKPDNPLREIVDVSEIERLRQIEAAARDVAIVLRDIHHAGGVPDARDVTPALRAKLRRTLGGLSVAVSKEEAP